MIIYVSRVTKGLVHHSFRNDTSTQARGIYSLFLSLFLSFFLHYSTILMFLLLKDIHHWNTRGFCLKYSTVILLPSTSSTAPWSSSQKLFDALQQHLRCLNKFIAALFPFYPLDHLAIFKRKLLLGCQYHPQSLDGYMAILLQLYYLVCTPSTTSRSSSRSFS